MRAAIYARVSSDKQREKHTVASQLAELPRWIADKGWTLVGNYVDDGKTAKAGHLAAREAFTRLLTDARAKLFDVVVVVDIDRITRAEDLEEQGQILGAFQRAGVKLASPKSGVVELNNLVDILRVQIEAQVAADENRKRRERTIRGRLHAAREGRPSGPVPYGLRYTRAGGWELDPERAPIVRECFERVAQGESTEAIAADLHRRGVQRARSSQWQRERVYAIVTQPAYRGEWIANRQHRVAVKVPPIVDDALWYQVEEVLLAAQRRGLRRTKHSYLLEGIARCTCGGQTLIHSTSGSKCSGRYYYCKQRRRAAYGEERCTMRPWRVDEADARVWRRIVRFLGRPDLPGRVASFLSASAGPDERSWARDLAGNEKRLAHLQVAEAAILDRFRRDLISQGALDHELERISAERRLLTRSIEQARRQLEGARQTRGAASQALGLLEQLREGLEGADATTRRELVQALVPERLGHHVILGAGDIEVQLVLAEAPSTVGLADDPGCRKQRQAKLSFLLVA